MHQPQGDLPSGYRLAVWLALGPNKTSQIIKDNPGWLRRIHLGILTTKHVLPIWQKRFPRSRLPYKILAQIDTILENGAVDTNKDYDEDFTYAADNFMDNHQGRHTQYSVGVAYCACQALWITVGDTEIFPDHIDYTLNDDKRDPDSQDPAYYAAMALAEGRVGESKAYKDKRRAFWEWWLDEAVPSAWNAVP